MERRLASLVQPIATGLALLLLLLIPASCSKDQAPVGPDHTVSGSKSPPSATATLSPSQGAVVLKSGVSLSQFLNANDLVLVTTIPNMPAVGGFPARWYYCVRTEDGSNFADKIGFATFQNSVEWYSENYDVKLSEDDIVSPDRDGLTFDDNSNPKYTYTDYVNQATFEQIGVVEARTVAEGDPSTVIAVLDTGIDTSHPLFQASPQLSYQLGGNYVIMPPTGGATEWPGNSQDEDQDAYVDDGEGHGTFVAGIIYTAARQATIRVYKVLNDEGLGTVFGLAKAIRAAELAGVEVISLSAGTLEDNEMLHHVIAQAVAQGIVVVTSAGNKNVDLDEIQNMQYPAAWPEVVTVSAVDGLDVKFSHANHGLVVDLVAPGVDVISTIPSVYYPHRYASTSGTSVAVPWIAGTIAVVMEARSCNAVAAYDAVYHDVDIISNPGYDLGRGRLNMARAVGYVPPPKP